ncbi:MAG: hypothetical protein Q9168_000244 [Polycauliona sp. 1 TL-2023]
MAAGGYCQPPAQGFESESGQVFIERTCKAGSMTPEWTWQTRRSLQTLNQWLNHDGPGSPSLRDISIRKVLANTLNLTPAVMETLPLHLTHRLWLEIETSLLFSGLDSLRTWKIFASAFVYQGNLRLVDKSLVISESTTHLTECINHIVSPPFHFITFLSLSDLSCSRTELIQLSRLTNLGMLKIAAQDSSYVSLEDSIIRAWGRAACEAGAFSRFRILVCKSQINITGRIFAYFRDFPALDMVLLDRCSVSPAFLGQSRKHDWHAEEHSKLGHDPDALVLPAWKDLYSDSWKKRALFDKEALHESFEPNEGLQPILSVSLGSTVNVTSGMYSLSPALPDNIWLFRRDGLRHGNGSLVGRCPQKRLLAEDSEASSRLSKRPALRSSRQRTMKDMLADFHP